MNWVGLFRRRLAAPFTPRLRSSIDLSNFDAEFTSGSAALSEYDADSRGVVGPDGTVGHDGVDGLDGVVSGSSGALRRQSTRSISTQDKNLFLCEDVFAEFDAV